ncbi:hypothetical protein QGM71_16660 [Virgibacillus sp. C22-A2]|uniref:Isochorismatase family protein n=1 Tax=Virgibacillus tibetensis TaxID=3042313 RepID=A0ABU6KL31_9BACI|nr:hypothetical protein [Virgibacillus sp. C22-A2]
MHKTYRVLNNQRNNLLVLIDMQSECGFMMYTVLEMSREDTYAKAS